MKDYGEDLEGRIAAYIDGKLPPAEAARLEVFLANSDPALAEQVITMLADRHAVRSLPKPHAPEDLAARIMEQVERTSLLNDSEHFAAPHRPWWQSRLAVAAALLLILSGFGYFILEAVRRPDSTWRQTVMDDGAHRDELHDLAAAPKTSPPTPLFVAPSAAASAPAAIAGTAATPAPAESAPTAIAAANRPAPITSAREGAAAQQVAADVVEKSQPAPIELTLVIRSPDDESRLRTELARFVDANPAVGTNQLAQNNSTNLAPEGQAAATGSFNLTRGQSQLTQNNSNYNEQLAARNAYRGAGGGGGAGQPSAQNARNYQYYDPSRRGFNAPLETRAAKDELTPQPPVPYRVTLRPDQLRQLTTDFQLQSDSPSPATTPTDAATLNSASAPPATQSAQKTLNALLNEKPADTWIDCIITLLPSPASTAPVTPPNSPAASQPR